MNRIKASLLLLITISLIQANPFYGNILFESGSDTLSGKAELKLSKLIEPLSEKDLKKSGEKIIVTGFTDQTGDEKEDTTLAYKRALTIAEFIHSSKGISKDQIIARGESKKRYHILTVTAEGRRLNRRAEIIIKKVRKKEVKKIPVILNIVESNNTIFSDTTKSLIESGDTVYVNDKGFCRLSYGSRSTIDLDENSVLTIIGKQLVIIKGTAQLHRSVDDEKPPVFKGNKTTIILSGDGVISLKSDGSLFTSIYSGNGVVKSPYGKKEGIANQGIAVLESGKTVVKTTLPTAPILELTDTIQIISGLTAPVTWNRSGELFHYRLSNTPLFDSLITEKRITDTATTLASTPGTYYIQIQATNTPGFNSLWSKTEKVTVEKKPSLISLSPFEDTLFLTSHNRPYSISGVADPATRLFLDSMEMTLDEEGRFKYDFMLKDEINTFNVVSLNPDNSKDTVQAFVLYTGADEAIYVNDSILGKEAFTTSRYYKFRGNMPTATALKINGEEISLDKNRYFEKRFKLPGYEKQPINMEITFENGHTKTINASVERIEHDTPLQQALFSFLGLAAVSALFVFIAFQSN